MSFPVGTKRRAEFSDSESQPKRPCHEAGIMGAIREQNRLGLEQSPITASSLSQAGESSAQTVGRHVFQAQKAVDFSQIFDFFRDKSVVSNKENMQSLKDFIKKYPGALWVRNSEGLMPLHVASAMGIEDACDVLISEMGDITATTLDGDTALHLAVRNRQVIYYKLQRLNPALIGIPNKAGYTPFHEAVLYKDASAVRLFVGSLYHAFNDKRDVGVFNGLFSDLHAHLEGRNDISVSIGVVYGAILQRLLDPAPNSDELVTSLLELKPDWVCSGDFCGLLGFISIEAQRVILHSLNGLELKYEQYFKEISAAITKSVPLAPEFYYHIIEGVKKHGLHRIDTIFDMADSKARADIDKAKGGMASEATAFKSQLDPVEIVHHIQFGQRGSWSLVKYFLQKGYISLHTTNRAGVPVMDLIRNSGMTDKCGFLTVYIKKLSKETCRTMALCMNAQPDKVPHLPSELMLKIFSHVARDYGLVDGNNFMRQKVGAKRPSTIYLGL